MSSQFFVERYAREKHQSYLREAAHDRLPRDLRVADNHAPGRPLRVQPARARGAAVILVVASLFSMGSAGGMAKVGPGRQARADANQITGRRNTVRQLSFATQEISKALVVLILAVSLVSLAPVAKSSVVDTTTVAQMALA